MVKGASIKFKSYDETPSKILDALKLQREIKKYDRLIIKPFLSSDTDKSTSTSLVENILQFCLTHKNPVAEVFIAEGADGEDTEYLFESQGYKKLAEKYNVGLVDLNNAETEEMAHEDMLKFESIHFPKILLNSFLISVTKLSEDEENGITGSISNMLGAYPSKHYSGFFSSRKNKIRRHPLKYSIYDILQIKQPDFAVIDASDRGYLLAGLPFELDKNAAKLLEKNWQMVSYLNLIHENSQPKIDAETTNKISEQ